MLPTCHEDSTECGITVDRVIPRVSCHHGDVDKQNQLVPAAAILASNPEIDLVEIDVVWDGTNFVTSHDSTEKNLALSSPIADWFELVLPQGKSVWLDVKDSQLTLISRGFTTFPGDKFAAFLAEERSKWQDKSGIDLADRVFIGCQFPWMYSIIEANPTVQEFRIIHDLPTLSSYVFKMVFCCGCLAPWLRATTQSWIRKSIREDGRRIVSLDREFFADSNEMGRFIDSESSFLDVCLVYSFSKTDEVPVLSESSKVRLVVQYDYHGR